ncbi:MAG TPA: helix-hairpin-helix domain-containing protein [Bacillales bacterium]|nr:helix-hairpin-helix domain-containing protein [Bacillales bacterium]
MKDWFVAKKYYVLIFIVMVLGFGYYFFIYQSNQSSKETLSKLEKNDLFGAEQKIRTTSQSESKQKIVETIMIDMKGEVKNPGVYQSNKEERVMDVINRAGGLTEKADESQVNFAAHVRDEMIIFIPAKGQVSPIPSQNPTGGNTSGNGPGPKSNKINLNTADENELQNLPGIGPSKATAIVAFRNENGPFQTIEDLKKISGIGDKTFEKLKESIMVQ